MSNEVRTAGMRTYDALQLLRILLSHGSTFCQRSALDLSDVLTDAYI